MKFCVLVARAYGFLHAEQALRELLVSKHQRQGVEVERNTVITQTCTKGAIFHEWLLEHLTVVAASDTQQRVKPRVVAPLSCAWIATQCCRKLYEVCAVNAIASAGVLLFEG